MPNTKISSKLFLSPDQDPAVKRANKREDTRSMIATIYIVGHLIILGLLVLLTTFANMKQDAVKDFLLAVGSPLGFIIGYYFKNNDKD